MLVKADRSMEDEFYEENLKHSFNNGESWHTEGEIKEALEAKSRSCENCKYYDENGACKNESLDSMDQSLEFSDFWFSPTKDFCCNKHKPK